MSINTYSEVLVQITFLESKKGGRSVPFGQGFSPKLILDGNPTEFFTELNIDESETLFPGDQTKLEIKIKGYPGIYLHAGASFDLLEGSQIIGSGTIMKLIK